MTKIDFDTVSLQEIFIMSLRGTSFRLLL